MDFDFAAQRLEKEQSQLKGRIRHRPISVKAKKEADYRKKQQQLLKEKRDKENARKSFQQKVMTSCERLLGVRELVPEGLKATSIHGDGDKIALPPSILERLTNESMEGSASPWTFRIGIPNPTYTFPESSAMKSLSPPDEDDDMDDSDDDEDGTRERTEYLEELSHKYIAYSHATVVEFTQEEGHVGLPPAIAAALLDPKRRILQKEVPTYRTQDPAAKSKSDEDADENAMEMDGEEKTPGHLAWGAFDVPDVSLEISLVTLPKGRECTLIPTMNAIQQGFHGLKDIKLVLEQSLIRTRATLSVGDTVATWHRGKKYDLTVASVTPADWKAVSCINTDIEVEIGPNEEFNEQQAATLGGQTLGGGQKLSDSRTSSPVPPSGQTLGGQKLADSRSRSTSPVPPRGQFLGGGQTLSDSRTSSPLPPPSVATAAVSDLRPEPPASQTEGVCTVQLRADKGSGRRRFDVNVATVADLFAFASSLTSEESFQLVTRFPRRVVTLEQKVLSEVGIQAGQELFMVEKL